MIKLGDKICNFVSLYRSQNQSEDDFENFCNNFELTLDAVSATNPFLIVVIGDFNAKSSNWYTGDTTTFEGSKIEGHNFSIWTTANLNRLTFKENLIPLSILFSPLNQIWL